MSNSWKKKYKKTSTTQKDAEQPSVQKWTLHRNKDFV